MTQKTTDLTNEMGNIIYIPAGIDKTIKVVYEGEPVTREEALKIWFEILQNLKQ